MQLIQKSPLPPWQWNYLQYPFFALLLIFDMIMIQSPTFLYRLFLAILLILSPFIPYIRRFTVPCMAIFTWLITFYAVQFIPNTMKPQHIFVNLLPTLERVIYGANLAEIISRHTHPLLDMIAWIPYGVLHFAFPFIFSGLLFICGPPGSLAVFGRAFGYMNLVGVLTQLLVPTSAPWYELSYGSTPADYSVHGQPGGLSRIDTILGLTLYSTAFENSPIVFGAFPSLHSGCATLEMLFLSWLWPRLRPYCIIHVMWMWFATMYLTHHYLIDLVGGSIYATCAFYFFKPYLPVIRSDCYTRLDYVDVEVKKTVGNFIRSIEMEWLMKKTLNSVDDVENLMKETMAATSHGYVSEEEEEDSTNLFNHILLQSISSSSNKIKSSLPPPMTMYKTPSITTSPTCSEPSSPLTPLSTHSYLENQYKHL